jgi:hypothetical protein
MFCVLNGKFLTALILKAVAVALSLADRGDCFDPFHGLTLTDPSKLPGPLYEASFSISRTVGLSAIGTANLSSVDVRPLIPDGILLGWCVLLLMAHYLAIQVRHLVNIQYGKFIMVVSGL